MKIINVVQEFNVGGIQKLLLEYLRFFNKDKEIDYQVVVLGQNHHSLYDEICKNEHLKIHYLNCHNSNNKHYYVRKYLKWYRFNFKLIRFLRKERPDVVHSHNTRVLTLIETCIKRTIHKYKWFHTLHSDPYALHESHIPVAKRVFNKYKVKAICLNETQFFKAKERYGLKECLYLYNCFDQEKLIQNIIPRNTFRKMLGINQLTYVIGAVGRLDRVKNYPFMLNLFKEILKIKPDSLLLICGGGSKEDYEQIKEISATNGIDNKLLLLGNRDDMQNIYSSIDIFIQTSITESSSITALEAQCFGLKCVLSDAIPKESICTKKVVRLSLDDSLDIWIRNILKPEKYEKPFSKMLDYSIKETSKKMIKYYCYTQ